MKGFDKLTELDKKNEKNRKIIDDIYHDKHKIHTFITDANYQATLPYYCGLMQEAGANHSMLEGCSIPDLLKEGRTWILYKMKLTVERYPAWPEEIELQSWVTKPEKLFFPRHVRAVDHDGHLVFHGKAYWIVYNIERNRPERPKGLPFAPQEGTGTNGVDRDPAELSLDKIDSVDVSDLEAAAERNIRRYSPSLEYRHTDINGHITNCAYVEWILSCFDTDFRKAKVPKEFEIIFLHETREEDELEVVTQPDPKDPDWYIHEVVRENKQENKQETVCRARSSWVKREELL